MSSRPTRKHVRNNSGPGRISTSRTSSRSRAESGNAPQSQTEQKDDLVDVDFTAPSVIPLSSPVPSTPSPVQSSSGLRQQNAPATRQSSREVPANNRIEPASSQRTHGTDQHINFGPMDQNSPAHSAVPIQTVNALAPRQRVKFLV